MRLTKITIIDYQRIRCYKVVGKFTCFSCADCLAILVKAKCVKCIYATTCIFYHSLFANKQSNIKIVYCTKSLVIAITGR